MVIRARCRLLPLCLVAAAACEDSAPFKAYLGDAGATSAPDTDVTGTDLAGRPLEDAWRPAGDAARPGRDAQVPARDADRPDADGAPPVGDAVAPPGDGPVAISDAGRVDGPALPAGDAAIVPGADGAVPPGPDALAASDAVLMPGADALVPPGADALAASDALVMPVVDAVVMPGADAVVVPDPDAALPPLADALAPPPSDAVAPPPGDAAVAPLPDAAAPVPDAAPPPEPPARVCCLADAECAPGQHCSGGRCWDPAPVPPCDCAAPCPAGTACVSDDLACGQCQPASSLCTPACERDLTRAAWYYLAPDPPQNGQPLDLTGTLISDERLPGGVGRHIELERDDGRRFGYAYILPARVAFPFRAGESVHLSLSAVQVPGFETRGSAAGPEGVRLAVVERRGGEGARYLDLPFHIEHQGCGPTLIGNCLQQSPATLVFDVDGPRSPALHTGDSGTVGPWQVHVARVYQDENACDPDLHDLYANFVLVAAPR